jgi:hypothetical protein
MRSCLIVISHCTGRTPTYETTRVLCYTVTGRRSTALGHSIVVLREFEFSRRVESNKYRNALTKQAYNMSSTESVLYRTSFESSLVAETYVPVADEVL